MAPQKTVAKEAAKAPPREKKKTFGIFREKKFRKALALAKEFYEMKELVKEPVKGKGAEQTLNETWVSSSWGVIVGSKEVKERLADEGIMSIYNPKVAYKNEIILNRGLGSADSTFFVFIKFGMFRATALFTDPSSGEGGKALPKNKLVRKISSWLSKENWVSKVAEEVKKLAMRKRKESFYMCLHGHWGEHRGRDDGISPRRDVIRELMKWNYDVDGTGYHNWLDKEMLLDVTEREKKAGIVKIPSTEFTYRYIPGLGDNGFHINLWFASLEAAMDFHGRYLSGKAKNMPGLAPHGQEGVLRYIRRKRQDKTMAVGIAHPCCRLSVGSKGLEVGIVGMLEHKNEKGKQYKWRSIESFMKRNADGIAAYNTTVGGKQVRFEQADALREFKEVAPLIANYVGGEATFDQNNVNMALAYHMRHTKGKFIYFDHDIHNYAPTKSYFRAISPLAYGRTVIHLSKERFELLKKRGGISSNDVIRAMRGGRGILPEDAVPAEPREDCGPCADWMEISHLTLGRLADKGSKISMEAFLELDGGRLREVKKRRDSTYHLLKVPREISKGFQYAKLVLSEWWRRTSSMWRP